MGDFYLCFSVEEKEKPQKATSGEIVGYDFGLSTILTATDNRDIHSPEYLQKDLVGLKKLSRLFSKKRKGSNNWKKARKNLARLHIAIANRRKDRFFKLAHTLSSRYKLMSFEDLDMKKMAKLWGRKVLDHAFSEFLSILKHVSKGYDTVLHFCDRYFPSSKTCCLCDWYNKDLQLKDLVWTCQGCKTKLDRNRSACFNILRAGASAHGLGDIRPHPEAVSVGIQESHLL